MSMDPEKKRAYHLIAGARAHLRSEAERVAPTLELTPYIAVALDLLGMAEDALNGNLSSGEEP